MEETEAARRRAEERKRKEEERLRRYAEVILVPCSSHPRHCIYVRVWESFHNHHTQVPIAFWSGYRLSVEHIFTLFTILLQLRKVFVLP